MVLETNFYRGPYLEGVREAGGGGGIDFDQFIGYEPGQNVYWSTQGTLDGDVPFVGGSRITSGVGSRESFRFGQWVLGPHGGIDFIPLEAQYDTIRAIFRADVVANYWSDGTGWIVKTQVTPQLRADYAHLAQQSPLGVGSQIEIGDEVGPMGSTGTYATGAHLHLSCYTRVTPQHSWEFTNQRFLDPLPYIGRVFATQPESGVLLTTIAGGGLIPNVLKYAALGENLSSVSVTRLGGWLNYIPGAPAFVNEPFFEHFPQGWMPENEVVMLADRDS